MFCTSDHETSSGQILSSGSCLRHLNKQQKKYCLLCGSCSSVGKTAVQKPEGSAVRFPGWLMHNVSLTKLCKYPIGKNLFSFWSDAPNSTFCRKYSEVCFMQPSSATKCYRPHCWVICRPTWLNNGCVSESAQLSCLTWWWWTHQALVMILASQAAL